VLKNDQTLSEKLFTLPCHKMWRMNHTRVACVFNYAKHTLWLRLLEMWCVIISYRFSVCDTGDIWRVL